MVVHALRGLCLSLDRGLYYNLFCHRGKLKQAEQRRSVLLRHFRSVGGPGYCQLIYQCCAKYSCEYIQKGERAGPRG